MLLTQWLTEATQKYLLKFQVNFLGVSPLLDYAHFCFFSATDSIKTLNVKTILLSQDPLLPSAPSLIKILG